LNWRQKLGLPTGRRRAPLVGLALLLACVVMAGAAYSMRHGWAGNPHPQVDVLVLHSQIEGDDVSIRWQLRNRTRTSIGYGVGARLLGTEFPWASAGAEGLEITRLALVEPRATSAPERLVLPLDAVPGNPLELRVPLRSPGGQQRGYAVSDAFSVP
jgi:hypothetical protein